MIRTLIVDDQPHVRQGLRMRLALEPGLVMIGEAEDGEEAISMALQSHPDLILMDVEMPNMDGITAAAALHETLPETVVVLMSIYDSPSLQERAQQAGAVALFEKKGGLDALLEVIYRAFKRKEETYD
jgi:DNA-binding NarL/FixJ family response regulator